MNLVPGLLRDLKTLVVALLLVSGVAAQGVFLCDTGEICHACDGCGQIDPCQATPANCDECCSLVELGPAPGVKQTSAQLFWDAPVVMALHQPGLAADDLGPLFSEGTCLYLVPDIVPPDPSLSGPRAPPALG